MRLYLDDDLASRSLVRLLTQAGHDVETPVAVSLNGEDDAVHFAHAVRENRVLLSGNHDDYKNLHDLVVDVAGRHPGILIVRRENNPRRDLTPKIVVRAIDNLIAARVELANGFHILNHWR